MLAFRLLKQIASFVSLIDGAFSMLEGPLESHRHTAADSRRRNHSPSPGRDQHPQQGPSL